MVDNNLNSAIQSHQKLIKELENDLKKNFEQINIKIDEMIVYLNEYKKTLVEPNRIKTVDILLKSYENKKTNIQYHQYINMYKNKIQEKRIEILKNQVKSRNDIKIIEDCPPQISTSNYPNLHNLFEFEIIDHSNIQEMMKATINLCESSITELSKEMNLSLNYSLYFEELKKIKLFMNNLLTEGYLINSNIENYQSQVKLINVKVEKYKKKASEIIDYLLKKGIISKQQIDKIK